MANWMAKIVPPITAAVKTITTIARGTLRHIGFTIIPVKCKMSLMPEPEIPVYTPPLESDLVFKKGKPMVLVLVGLMVLVLLFALGFWLGKGKAPVKPQEVVDPGQVMLTRFGQPPTAPSELSFIFFNDVNRNGVFDQNESKYSNVSVELRRRGQENPFQTVPADTQGRVTISGLTPADYEVRYWFADFELGQSYGDFNMRNWYEIVTPTGENKPFPSDWESLPDESEVKIGVAEYVPDKLIVGQTANQLFLVDPTKPNFSYGGSHVFTDELWHRFTLVGDKVYYLANNELKFFDVKNRLTQTAIKPAYLSDQYNYRLSPDTKTLIYIDNGELNYLTADAWCGQGAIFDSAEGYRLLASSLRLNFRDNQQLVVVGRIANDQAEKVYLVACREGRLEGFVTDWAIDTVAPEPAPATWQEGGFKLDILLGEIDL